MYLISVSDHQWSTTSLLSVQNTEKLRTVLRIKKPFLQPFHGFWSHENADKKYCFVYYQSVIIYVFAIVHVIYSQLYHTNIIKVWCSEPKFNHFQNVGHQKVIQVLCTNQCLKESLHCNFYPLAAFSLGKISSFTWPFNLNLILAAKIVFVKVSIYKIGSTSHSH